MVLRFPGPIICNCVDAIPDIFQVGLVVAIVLVELQVGIVQDHAGDLGPNHPATSSVRKVEVVEMADEHWGVLLGCFEEEPAHHSCQASIAWLGVRDKLIGHLHGMSVPRPLLPLMHPVR